MKLEITRQGETFRFVNQNGYLCRVVWGGAIHSCCFGGHLQCGSPMKIAGGNMKELAERWVSQVLDVRNNSTTKKRK